MTSDVGLEVTVTTELWFMEEEACVVVEAVMVLITARKGIERGMSLLVLDGNYNVM